MNAGRTVIENFEVDLLEALHKREFGNVSDVLSKLDVIQEQPQLIDPYLEALVEPVLNILQDLSPAPLSTFQADLYRVLYYYTKIRGAKVVGKLSMSVFDSDSSSE